MKHVTALKRLAFVLMLVMLPAAPAAAAVELRGTTLTVSTSELSITFSGWNIQTLRNLLTNEIYISQPGPGWLDLNLKDPTETILTPAAWRLETDASGAQVGRITASDAVRTAQLTVGTANDEIFFRLEGRSSKPGMRSIFWGLQGFNPAGGGFIFPGQAGISFDAQTVPTRLGLEYPTHWEAQFVLYQRVASGLLLYARDPKPYFKRTIASRELGTLDVGVEVFTTAPWTTATEAPIVEWRLKGYRGTWRAGVEHYRNWRQGIWARPAPDSRRDWAKSIRGVVKVLSPEPSLLDALAAKVVPSKTLIYLVNWRNDSFDVNYPDYTPALNTGPFMTRARQLGFRVLLHMNALGVAPYHRVYPSMAPFQLKDPETEELIFWPWGLWPGNVPPPQYLPSFAFISPASSGYRRTLLDAIGPTIRSLRPDAVHLDAGGVMLNDSNGLIEGLTSIEGMMRLSQDVLAAFPDVVLSYESMTEILTPFYGLAQRWNSDFPPHPVNTYLMGREVNWYGFLDQANPDEPGFVDFVKRYEAQGVMPTLQIAMMADLSDDLPVTQSVLRMMRRFQELDLQPDWDGNWTGLLFRYISPDGRHAGLVEDTGTSVKVNVDGEVIYERIRQASTFKSVASIKGWPAYDSTTIYGLDPNREYWLDARSPWPEDRIHLANLPPDIKLGENFFALRDYGLFELERITPPAYDFVRGFAEAKQGVIYDGKDYQLGFGAAVQQTRTLIAGEVKGPVLLMQPPSRARGGATFVEYPLALPAPDWPAVLTFGVGLSDFGPRSDGALFVIRIDGTEVFREEVGTSRLVTREIDLTPWAGRTVRLRLIVHPGTRLNPISDLANWTDLKVSYRPRNSNVSFNIVVPDGSPQVFLNGTARSSGVEAGVAHVESSTPARFAVFTKAPPSVTIGQTLLDLPVDIWRVGYGGWPIPGRVETSGRIGPIVVGGRVERALSTIPPSKGKTVASYRLRLPDSASRLTFAVGLADSGPPLPPTVDYTSAGVAIRVNGELVWDSVVETNRWLSHWADLSQWRGQNVIIEIEADSQSNSSYDWVHWAELVIQ